MSEIVEALKHFFADTSTNQRNKLAALEESWKDKLGATQEEERNACLRLVQTKITSKKLVATRDAFVGALRRDGLPAAAKIPKPPSSNSSTEALASAPSGRDSALKGHNAELDLLVAADPRSPETQLVYRDWLEEQGLVDANGKVKLGAIADHKGVLSEAVWQRGFVRSCALKIPSETAFNLDEALQLLLDEPGAGRFLEELTLGLACFDDNHYKKACQAIGAARLEGLQKLYIGDYHCDECELNWSSIDASGMWPALPRLRELTLRAGSMVLGTISLPELRRFTTISGGLDQAAALSIAQATWPKIESLRLQYGQASQLATADIEVVLPILHSTAMPMLRELGITNCEMTDDVCLALPSSPLLPQLTHLDLSMGTMGESGAQVLLQNAGSFGHLQSLCLDDNYIPTSLQSALSGLCADVIFGDQRGEEPDPQNRYASAFE